MAALIEQVQRSTAQLESSQSACGQRHERRSDDLDRRVLQPDLNAEEMDRAVTVNWMVSLTTSKTRIRDLGFLGRGSSKSTPLEM
jgi:hypothetical protein